MIKKFTDALPYYNQQNTQPHLTIDDKTPKEEPKASTSRNLSIMNIFDNDNERKFIDDLTDGKKVFLYKRKKGVENDETEDVYSDIKLFDLDKLTTYPNSEILNFLNSDKLNSFTKQLASLNSNSKHDSVEIDVYLNSLRKYKKAIKDYLSSTKYLPKIDKANEDTDQPG